MVKRGKGRYKKDFGLDELYKSYIEETGNKKNSDNIYERKLYIDRKTYGRLFSDYFSLILEYIYQGKIYKLPHGNGEISIRKSKGKVLLNENGEINVKFLPIDWKKTKEVGKIIYHFNEHTDGYRYSFEWKKGGSIKGGKRSLYKFYAVRKNNRRIKTQIIDKKQDYFVR